MSLMPDSSFRSFKKENLSYRKNLRSVKWFEKVAKFSSDLKNMEWKGGINYKMDLFYQPEFVNL